MKTLYKFLIITIIINISACNKETDTTTKDLMYNMIANKTWYLDYLIIGDNTKTYIGQSTYFITYLKDGSTIDSDGLIGKFNFINNKGTYQIQITAKTVKGNTINYIHNIESIGNIKMAQSFISNGQTVKTTLFFTSK